MPPTTCRRKKGGAENEVMRTSSCRRTRVTLPTLKSTVRRSARKRPRPDPGETTSVLSMQAVARSPARTTRASVARTRPRISRDLEVEFGVTEEASVSKKTKEMYTHLVKEFQRLMKVDLRYQRANDLDKSLVRYFDRLYLEGLDPSRGQRMLAAILFHVPLLLGESGSQKLPRASRSLKGWRRMMPASTRRPWPWMVAASLAMRLLRGGVPSMGLCWLVMVDAYLRPGEAVDLLPRQVIPGVPGTLMRRPALLLNPDYRMKYSKTGELDESLVISRSWVGTALERFAAKRAREKHEKLWPFTLMELRNEYVRHALAAGLEGFQPVLYQGRHTGASLDRLENRRSLLDVQKRGRWRTTTSVMRYEKHALLQEVWSHLSLRHQAMARADARKLESEVKRRFGGTGSSRASGAA